MGKSALAYEFASQVKAVGPNAFHYVLWLGAKKRRLLDGTVQPINNPDFWDFPSLLDGILKAYGFTEDLGLPLPEKRAQVIRIMTELRPLFVADDVDSLPLQDYALEFITLDLSETRAKVLMTSRKALPALISSTTTVGQLRQEEAKRFLESKIRMFGLDAGRFRESEVAEILSACDFSPLYVEELLRLSKRRSLREALDIWKRQGGQEAREFSLRLEFETLSEKARNRTGVLPTQGRCVVH
jgi:hypothetical protein